MLLLVSAVLNAYYRTDLQKCLNYLIPYGRMSLTNYIMQSVIGSMLFYNWDSVCTNETGHYSQCAGGCLDFRAAIGLLPVVVTSLRAWPNGISVETGYVAEVSDSCLKIERTASFK